MRTQHAREVETGGPQLVERIDDPRARPAQFLRTFQIIARLGICDDTWRTWVKAGLAPAPVRNIPGRPRWHVATIEAFERELFRQGRAARRGGE